MPGRHKGKMDIGLFEKIVDELGNYAFTMVLHNWGEPLLNENISSMIDIAKQKRIKTILSSNLNFLEEEYAEALIQSGLDQLIISLDGTTAETYGKYRKGGNFHQVMKNIELLVKKKEDMKSPKPRLTWQFLVFKHNVHEIEQVKKIAGRLKVDDVDICRAQLGGPKQTPYIGDKSTAKLAHEWLLPDRSVKGEFDYFSNPDYLNKKKCYFLWKTITINHDGSVSPCCCVYDPSTDFGDIKKNEFPMIWNNDVYKSARGLFSKSKKNNSKIYTVCHTCKIFRKP
jgi:radical SAM protein with 4Fe4S-binding SPASM domain